MGKRNYSKLEPNARITSTRASTPSHRSFWEALWNNHHRWCTCKVPEAEEGEKQKTSSVLMTIAQLLRHQKLWSALRDLYFHTSRPASQLTWNHWNQVYLSRKQLDKRCSINCTLHSLDPPGAHQYICWDSIHWLQLCLQYNSPP